MKYLRLTLFFFCSFIFANDYLENVKKLSSEEFYGRGPGSDGINKAADFISDKYKTMGLEPINGSYFQEFEINNGKKLAEGNAVYFEIIIPKPGVPAEKLKPVQKKWEINSDWLPLSITKNGVFQGEMVFVGYGISTEDKSYDDYEGINVENKAVIILNESPLGNDKTGKFARYSNQRYKISNAKKHNAGAIIFINPQGDSADVFIPLEKADRMAQSQDLVIINVARKSIEKFFPKENALISIEKKINSTQKPISFDLINSKINITTNIEDLKVKVKNVVGVLNNNKEKYIALGAHYDHLGMTKSGNSRYRGESEKIHYGADDNASGTAGLFELIEKLKNIELNSNVIFTAWTAEEMGLLGSEYYVNNSPIDLKKIDYYFNYDMIGRLGEKDIQVLGTATSNEFDGLIDKVSTELNLKINKIKTGIGPSDHTSFFKKGIPVLAFFSGIHSDYHTPEDTYDKIDTLGASKIIDFSVKLIEEIEKNGNLTYVDYKDNEKINAIKRGTAKVKMGVIPNYSDIEHGFIIDGVNPNSPAQKAGMKGGDIIIEVNNESIKDIYDFMYSYMEKNPGDTVEVKVLRDGNKNPITLKVTLESNEN